MGVSGTISTKEQMHAVLLPQSFTPKIIVINTATYNKNQQSVNKN